MRLTDVEAEIMVVSSGGCQNADAMFNLGLCYKMVSRGEKDAATAFSWTNVPLRQVDTPQPNATFAVCYYTGECIAG
jgi:hypothetical protein